MVGDTQGSHTALWGPQGECGHHHGPETPCLVLAQGSSSDKDRAGAGGAAGTLCTTLFSPPSLHPRQTHAMEANHMPPQRSSPFICTNPLICRPSSSSPQRSSDKSRRGAENCTAAACPVQRGQRRLPQRSHHPRAPRRCTGESGQQRGQAGGPCPHLPNGDQKE